MVVRNVSEAAIEGSLASYTVAFSEGSSTTVA